AAQKALEDDSSDDRLRQSLRTIDELTKRAQSEMRRFIFEWGPEGIGDGLVPAFTRHVSSFSGGSVGVRVEGPSDPLPLTRTTESQLFGIAREALANCMKHAQATAADIRVAATPKQVVLEIVDDGRGFDPAAIHAGHFGLESMRSRADEIGAALYIISAPGRGTVVRVEVPAEVSHNGN